MSLIVRGFAYRLALANPCVSVSAALARKKGNIVTLAVIASQRLAHVRIEL